MPPEVATKSDKTRRGAGKRYVRETDGQDSSDEDGDRRAAVADARKRKSIRQGSSKVAGLRLPHGKSLTSQRIPEMVLWCHLASKKPSSSA